jgi:DNA-binding transcriptional ArsR family regulator
VALLPDPAHRRLDRRAGRRLATTLGLGTPGGEGGGDRRLAGPDDVPTAPLPTEVVSANLPLVQTYQDPGGWALEALGEPTRRRIFESLVAGPKSVRELADVLPVSRPAVSQHLKVLKDSGLVVDRADGARRVYRVLPEGVAAMREYLDRMWSTALTAFAAAVEQEPDDGEGQQ